MKAFIDSLHPKITRAGIAGGLALVAEGVCQFIGVPSPPWLAVAVPLVAAIVAGYLKAA